LILKQEQTGSSGRTNDMDRETKSDR